MLRGSHGDVAGAESDASSVERSASEHGNRPWSARGHAASVAGRAGHTVGRVTPPPAPRWVGGTQICSALLYRAIRVAMSHSAPARRLRRIGGPRRLR